VNFSSGFCVDFLGSRNCIFKGKRNSPRFSQGFSQGFSPGFSPSFSPGVSPG